MKTSTLLFLRLTWGIALVCTLLGAMVCALAFVVDLPPDERIAELALGGALAIIPYVFARAVEQLYLTRATAQLQVNALEAARQPEGGYMPPDQTY